MNSTSTTTSVVEPAKGSVPRNVPLVVDVPAMREWADELVERASTQGVDLTGDNGLLTALVRPGAADRAGGRVERSSRLRAACGGRARIG